jgi:alpha-glucosidase (family GH31 glycosyl hydrolase)
VIDLHTKGMKWIPILDTAVAKRSDGSYEIYNDGVANDVFIKTDQGSVFTGQVKPNDVAFPDFMKPATVTWWTLQLDIFYNMIPFDGLWTDRNEAF